MMPSALPDAPSPSPPAAHQALPPHAAPGDSPTRTLALRLRPGDDLKDALLRFAKARGLQAGFVMAAVGSLRVANLRFADAPAGTALEGPFEIVSLSGTLTAAGAHLHLAIADRTGKTLGGHLMPGCLVYTTAEVVIGEAAELAFPRVHDPLTGYPELAPARRVP